MTLLCWTVYLAFILVVVVVCEISIVQNYIHLSYGRYNWWWRTFIYGGSVSFWLFATLTYHLLVDLRVNHITTIIVYMMI